MFHFNFDLEDGVDEGPFPEGIYCPDGEHCEDTAVSTTGEPFSEIDLDSLLETLPPKISYSIISATSGSSDGHHPELKFARRDLFDARFQLISEGTGDDPEPSAGQCPIIASRPGSLSGSSSFASALRFIDAPSDLVPLVYEGGLKTWECSLDLAGCLKRDGHAASAKGKRILELGCGTAIPALCVLQAIFSSPPTGDAETHVHLQDYNASVLHLVTAPNVFLAWCKWTLNALVPSLTPGPNPTDTSPAADAYRSHAFDDENEAADADSELHITTQLLSAFRNALRDYRLRLRFFSGSWDAFELARTGGRYDLVLTSETIYCSESLGSLVRVMRDACTVGPQGYEHLPICLMAAKTVYFGVGGGVAEFIRSIESTADRRGNRGRVRTIWERSIGVSRKVMCVWWARE